MIKRSLTVLFLTIICISFGYGLSLDASLDLASIQDLVPRWSESTYQISSDLRSPITDYFELRLPLSITINERSSMFESGLFLVYHPWQQGPFCGISLIQFGLISGTSGLEKTSYGLNEALFGWTITVKDRLLIEPSVSLRDPSGVYKSEYLALKGEYPCYKTVRFHLAVGWRVWSNDNVKIN